MHFGVNAQHEALGSDGRSGRQRLAEGIAYDHLGGRPVPHFLDVRRVLLELDAELGEDRYPLRRA